jgi:hypothetical protein
MSDVTQEQIVAAAGAERLLGDPVLQGALDEIVARETERAVFLTDAGERELARMMVLVVGRLRSDLRGAIEWVLEARNRQARDRSFE